MPLETDNLEKVLATIKKKYGEGDIRYGDQYPDIKRIPTGSLELDAATHGGIPLGRWSHFYGPPGGAKTLTCWNIIKQAQDMGLSCAYYNIEKQFLPQWVERKGIDLSKLHVVDGSIIEEAGAKLESLLGVINVHVLDSLAAAISIDELAGKTEEWKPGIQARAWGKVLRRAQERFDDEENSVIMVNQTRQVFGKMMGSEEPTSGRAVEYISSMSLQFRKSHWLFKDDNGVLSEAGSNTDTFSGDSDPEGMEFQIRVAKSRVCPPHGSARMRLDFETGNFDAGWELTKAAIYRGIAQRGGSWYTVPGHDKVQGEKKLRELILQNVDLQKTIKKAILNGNSTR
jgi:recombination protein RecA